MHTCKYITCECFQEMPLFTQVDPVGKVEVNNRVLKFSCMLTECLFPPQLGMCQSDQSIGFAPERERDK